MAFDRARSALACCARGNTPLRCLRRRLASRPRGRRVIGALFPFSVGVTRLRKVLSGANVTIAGYRLQEKQIRAALKELEAAAIVVRDHNGVQAAPGWELFLTRAAHQAHSLAAIAAAFFQSGPTRSWDGSDETMLFRVHVVLGDFAALEELTDGEPTRPASWRFLADPPAVDLLERLPPGYREQALAGCLDHAIETAAPPEPVIDVCRRLSGELSGHAADIAFLRILQGRLEDAEDVFAVLPAAERESRAAATGLAATRALLAVLRGEDADARAHLEAALAAEKRGSRKRLVFPDSRAFTLALLALVRANTPESIDMVEGLLKAADRREVEREAELRLVRNALAAQREEVVYLTGEPTPRLDLLFDALALAWRGSPLFRDPAWRDALAAYRDRASAGGHAWVAAECDALLRTREPGRAGGGRVPGRPPRAHGRDAAHGPGHAGPRVGTRPAGAGAVRPRHRRQGRPPDRRGGRAQTRLGAPGALRGVRSRAPRATPKQERQVGQGQESGAEAACPGGAHPALPAHRGSRRRRRDPGFAELVRERGVLPRRRGAARPRGTPARLQRRRRDP